MSTSSAWTRVGVPLAGRAAARSSSSAPRRLGASSTATARRFLSEKTTPPPPRPTPTPTPPPPRPPIAPAPTPVAPPVVTPVAPAAPPPADPVKERKGSSFLQRLAAFLMGAGVGCGVGYYHLAKEIEGSTMALEKAIAKNHRDLNDRISKLEER